MSENGKTMTSDAVSRMDEFVDSFQKDVHRFCWDSLSEGEEGSYGRINELLLQMSWPRPHQEKTEKEEPEEETRTCDSCCWWDNGKAEDTKHGADYPKENHNGLCRLKTPNCVATSRDVFWPVTLKKDWCAKYRAKLDKEVFEAWKETYLKVVN